MIKPLTLLLGAGTLLAGLALPIAASAHGGADDGLAFVIRAAAGHAFDEERRHRAPPAHGYRAHWRDYRRELRREHRRELRREHRRHHRELRRHHWRERCDHDWHGGHGRRMRYHHG